jgi:putative DNA primase/helicase
MTASAASDAWVMRARSVAIEDEIARRGIQLRRHGKELIGPCPRCGGTDRFAINVTKQVFNCRGCEARGDVIDLVMFLDGSDFIRAGTTLAGEPPKTLNGNGSAQRHDVDFSTSRTEAAVPKKVIAAKYKYQDELGNLAFGVARIEYYANGTFVTGLPPKGDIVDWASRGGTVEQFHTLIAYEAKPWMPGDHKADEDQPEPNATKKQQPPEQQQNSGNLESAPASSFKMAGLNWLWPNRFALGKLGLIVGLPDRGKGLITADMTARVTNGDLWPCGEGRALKGRVLILSAEDDVEDTIVPRLVAAGANLNQVEILRMVRQGDSKRMFSLVSDLELLRRKVEELGDVVMIDIDPMSAYLGVGKIDSYRTTDVRGVLAPLTEFAAAKQVFVLGVLHFNKKTDVNNAMLRISDSLAFAATARHCYVVVDDLENDRRLFVKAKNNLAPDTKALSYGVNTVNVGNDEKTGKAIWAPRVAWGLEHVEITATQAMEAEASGRSSANPREAAKTFLTNMLVAGPVAKSEIEEAADANCIAVATLKRAKAELGIIAKKSGLKGGWTWQLPAQQTPHKRDHND